MEYIVLDLSRSTKEVPMFWRDNDLGYTTNPFEAGRYDHLHMLANWDYYNDGVETMAVPLTTKAMEKMGFKLSWDSAKHVEYFKRPLPKDPFEDFK